MIKRLFAVTAITALIFTGCGNIEEATPTPVPTETPTTAPEATTAPEPTESPVPTETPTPEPTPEPGFDISTLTNGGTNAMATFSDGKLQETAPIEPGSIIYANNMDSDKGNVFAGKNYTDAEFALTDAQAHSGKYSIKVTKRKKKTQGISGSGIALDAENGLDYKALVGHTVELRCFLYYGTDSFEVADELSFALFDSNRSETIKGYTFGEKDNDIIKDSHGNPILKDMEAPVLLGTCNVKKGVWTECVFTFTVEKATKKDGFLFFGTKDEAFNSLSMYSPYLIDDLTIMVVE